MIERPDADALMAGPLGDWLSQQDALRAAAKEKAARYTRYGWIGAIVVGLLALVIFRDLQAAFAGGAMAFAAGAFFARAARKQVTDVIKAEINSAIAGALQVAYAPAVTDMRCYEAAKAFQLLPSHDDTEFEDEWSGEVGGRPFRLHEAHLTEDQGSGDSRKKVTVFRGTIVSVGFARRFHGTTLVERERIRRRWYGAEKDEIELGGVTLARAEMGDPRFEDLFNVWTNDPVESRYLVHPEYMERLVAVEDAYAGQNIRALFHGGELLIALETGDLFESGSLEAQEDRALLDRSIEQFCSLGDLASRLNERARGNFAPG